MKKLVVLIYLVFIFSGGMAAYFGLMYGNPFLAGVGLFCVGIGLILIGINDIATRESVELDDAGYMTIYRGWSAIFGGLLWVVLGIAVLVGAIAVFFGQQDALIQWAGKHPGSVLIGLGLVALSSGGRMLFGAEEQKGSALSLLISLPGRAFGLLLIFIGVVLLAAGVLEILLPGVFQHGIGFFQVWWKGIKCLVNPVLCGQ